MFNRFLTFFSFCFNINVKYGSIFSVYWPLTCKSFKILSSIFSNSLVCYYFSMDFQGKSGFFPVFVNKKTTASKRLEAAFCYD